MTDKPWITYEAQKYLSRLLNQHMRVFEWGSGGSTLYFAKHCGIVYSVEHDQMWHYDVTKAIREMQINNVVYFLKQPEPGRVDGYYPGSFTSYDRCKKSNFEKYCRVIETITEQFDFISVDGRARVSCIQLAVDRLKPGGVLMLDNSERTCYTTGTDLLAGWDRKDFYGDGDGGRWQTTFFTKPKQ